MNNQVKLRLSSEAVKRIDDFAESLLLKRKDGYCRGQQARFRSTTVCAMWSDLHLTKSKLEDYKIVLFITVTTLLCEASFLSSYYLSGWLMK